MAEFLKRRYGLVVLKVALEGSGSSPTVRCQLQAAEEGVTNTQAEMSFPPEEFGLPARLDGRAERKGLYEFQLPEALGETISQFLMEAELTAPFWIHLVSPYGFLAAIPWEQLLAPVGVPVLRLPDFLFSPPSESPHSLDVAVCASVPVAKGGFMVAEYMARLAEAYEAVERKRIRLHLFSDLEAYDELQRLAAGIPSGRLEVRVYDPNASEELKSDELQEEPSRAGRARELTSPWLRWMHEALRSGSIDAVHFVCHGYLSSSSGNLALAQSPTLNEDRRSARFVGSAELNTFLNRIGAWSTLFTSPQGNFSPLGLRLLADAMVRIRPGPMLHQAGTDHADWENLADFLRLLYALEPVDPPLARGYFVSCQPNLVASILETEPPRRRTRGVVVQQWTAPPVEAPMSHLFTEDETPQWLSAATRYVEQRQFQVQEIRESAREVPLTKARIAELKATEEALTNLARLIEKHAGPEGGVR